MVAPEMKIKPGIGPVELPPPGRYTSRRHLVRFLMIGQALIRPDPDALLVRIHLAHPDPAAAALAIAGMFGTLRLGAEKPHMLDTAVTAMPAVQQD